jgi:hypothetical protein
VAEPSPARRIAAGLFALATIPAVGWLSFSYHVAVGIMVTLIYGAGALLYGASSIVSGVALAAARRLPEGDPEPIPAARLLEPRKPTS